MDAGGSDDDELRVLSALAMQPGRVRAFDDLIAVMGAEADAVDRVVRRLVAQRLVWDYWVPGEEFAHTKVRRRRYVELTEAGKSAGERFRSRPLVRRRGVVGTFLWEGWDAARIAWFARPRRDSRSRARLDRSRVGSRRRAHDELAPMLDELRERVVAVLRREGWAAAYGLVVERRRTRAQQRAYRR